MSLRWTEEELEEYRQRQGKPTGDLIRPAARATFPKGEGCRGGVAPPAQIPTERPTKGRAEGASAAKQDAPETRGQGSAASCAGRGATEDEEQMALFTWANHMAVTGHFPELSRLFHVPNGGSRGPAEAGRFKAMGVKPGVPDVFLDVPRGGFHGLRIEMKRRHGGKVSEDQTDWIDWYNATGYRAVICYGWDEARMEIEDYLRGGGEDGEP